MNMKLINLLFKVSVVAGFWLLFLGLFNARERIARIEKMIPVYDSTSRWTNSNILWMNNTKPQP